jgi:hypothetical protein
MGFKENLKAELNYSGMLVKELSALSGMNHLAASREVSRKRRFFDEVRSGKEII